MGGQDSHHSSAAYRLGERGQVNFPKSQLPQLPVKGEDNIYLEVKPLALGWHLLNEM